MSGRRGMWLEDCYFGELAVFPLEKFGTTFVIRSEMSHFWALLVYWMERIYIFALTINLN